MKKRLKVAGVLAAIAVITSSWSTALSFAQWDDSPDMGFERKHDKMKNIMETLNLSQEQKDQVAKQHHTNKEKFRVLRDRMAAKRLELKKELEESVADMNKVNSIVSDIKVMMGEQLELRVGNILTMKQILTPEQFKRLQGMKKDKPDKKSRMR